MSAERLPPYQAKQVREAGRQYYVTDRGDRVPSVTAILNATKPPEQKKALFDWQQRIGVEEASQITRAASRRGTGTHRHVRQYLEGEKTPCPEAVRPYWESMEPIVSAIEQVRLVEGQIFHDQLRYGGVVDCVATFEGTPCICEWKTSDRPKQTIERLYDYPLQLAAYCGAVNQLYQEYELNLRHALLVVAIPEMPAEVFWFEPEAMADYWEQWEERVDRFWRRLGYFR